jgi:alpha-galactosidase/6-phospho-beta-glucosidase family protein
MTDLKIAIVGVGSFVFGPSMLNQVIREQRLSNVELALVDIDAEMVELMAGVGQLMAEEAEISVTISTHTQRPAALHDANFVISSIVREGFKRFAMDYEIIQRYLPHHLVTEFGGVAGISNSLRQISLISELAADIRQYCPAAWLLNVSNPLPRVCQAAQQLGVKTLGFCAVSLQAYSMAWQLLKGESLIYPFEQACQRWSITTAGVNHFVWMLDFRDKETGEDLLPALLQALAEGKSSGNPVSEKLARETGYPLLPYDDHTRDFLSPGVVTGLQEAPFHGSTMQREQRIELLKRIVQRKEALGVLLQNPSWERPVDVIKALKGWGSVSLHALDMPNVGQISNLPRDVFVETPCEVTRDGLQPAQITLPLAVLPLTLRTAQVSDTIVRAALAHSRELVYQAVELDPTIEDKAAGRQAIDACLDAHADLLPQYV